MLSFPGPKPTPLTAAPFFCGVAIGRGIGDRYTGGPEEGKEPTESYKSSSTPGENIDLAENGTVRKQISFGM